MSEEVDLTQIIRTLWRRKLFIVTTMIVCGAVAGAAGFLLPKTYVATTILAPVSDSTSRLGSGASSLLSQYGDLGSLIGVSVSGDGKKAETVAVLQSEALTERYINENNLLPILYAKRWDAGRQVWKVSNEKDRPTAWKANNFFKKKVRSIATDTKTGLVTMKITWTDPKLAAQWANGLVAMTNQYLRDKAISESERNMAYLEEQAAKTTVVEVRNAIYESLESEIKKVMAARGNAEYALRVVDPAIAPELPSTLPPLFWLAGGLALGLILSASIAIARSSAAQHE